MALLDDFLQRFNADFLKKINVNVSAIINKEEDEFKKIKSERDQIKQSIRENLKKQGFTQSESEEVFIVVETYFEQMEEAKKPLMLAPPGTDNAPIAKKVKENVTRIVKQMSLSLKLKMEEIRERKGRSKNV
jgi:hypothetical protein